MRRTISFGGGIKQQQQQQQKACISRILALINWKIPFAFTLYRNRKENLVKTHIKPTAEETCCRKDKNRENKRQLSLHWGCLEGCVLILPLNLATKSMVTSRFHLQFRKAQIMIWLFVFLLVSKTLLRENILWLKYCSQVHQCLLLGWGERNSLELRTKLSRKKESKCLGVNENEGSLVLLIAILMIALCL